MGKLHTFIQALLSPEHGRIALHHLLHIQPDVRCGFGPIRVPEFIKVGDRGSPCLGLQRLLGRPWLEVFFDMMCHGPPKHNNIQQRISPQPVRAVDAYTCGFPCGIEPGHGAFFSILVDGKHLARVAGRNTAHIVVDSGEDRNRFLGDINTGEDGSSLGDAWQAFVQDGGRQVGELQIDVVALGADAAALADLNGHGAGDNVTGGKVLGCGSVAFHETLTLRVKEITTFATGA
ncbi:hypothetical protein BC937DRAFT_94514 [Endogone sp. FLAS-F59071]|nr:hypothetical protein BC937DRAFT_94514 [Endogone sp. FLAS-F59071]|eukprot:RUS13983.1 hypothetical protein BC937DRAFT_94514 [Endogone sp. FLAS-F59071]